MVEDTNLYDAPRSVKPSGGTPHCPRFDSIPDDIRNHELIAEMPDSVHAQDLQRVLRFTGEELALNQQGHLSERQIRRLTIRRQTDQRQLKWATRIFLALGIAALFYSTMLAFMAWGVAGGAYVIQVVGQKLKRRVRQDPTCSSVSGPIERHSSSRGTADDAWGREYRIWAGMQYSTTEDGRRASSAEKMFTVPKEVWDLFREGEEYTIYHHRGTVLSAEQCNSS